MMLDPQYYMDVAGQWRWRVKATNGEIVAASSEGFASKQSAEENYAKVAEFGIKFGER